MKIILFGIAVAALVSFGMAPIHAQEPKGTEVAAGQSLEKSIVYVRGSKMAYVDHGEGPTVLFVHGNPTSSFIWRNIIPHIADNHRAIAVDLIGMGASEKPDISYSLQDHLVYLEGFVEALGLNDITLVLHDWGGGLGTYFAANNADKVKAVALMEAAVPPVLPIKAWDDLQPESVRNTYRAMRDPTLGPKLILEQNIFIEQVIPSGVLRTLSEAELDAYGAPFLTKEDRKPLLAWPMEIPIEGEPERNVVAMSEAMDWLTTSEVPKLVLYATPGWLITPEVTEWIAANYSNVETRHIGAGLHYIQEDQPEAIGRNISDWLRDRVD